MALITEKDRFNPDAINNQIVGIAANIGRHDSGMHSHQKAQLLYAPSGSMSITLENQQCILPPTRAAWIPAGVRHCAVMTNVVAYRSVYFDISDANQQEDQIRILSVNPLLRELIERMAFWPWQMPYKEQEVLVKLFWQELSAAPDEALLLPLPSDGRLTTWLKQLSEEGHTPSPLNEAAQSIGASEKTISRIFSRETGMPYQAWRQQWRLMKAIELLSENKSVSTVAFELDFSSDSAFVSFFRKQTGSTPSVYIKRANQ
ncbi:helix-turn-helix transcriptional regulator [Photobacterium rosenbergii]|uniref:Helix-turn-helix transcriptional regulator n=1 Tax=Photobacterium rosenbergii TaxID=294936 RepID=A0ABU3ZCJ9_9GAMM|nr:helix-turn-helix transcriptional regulator [Photobacterium rosenbergii]MDV5167816.1 helix-turn-helix transcriptional regulator [Photobacterium rosenbergii]